MIWSQEEDQILIQLVTIYGTRWRTIASCFSLLVPGTPRSEADCEARWNTRRHSSYQPYSWSHAELQLLYTLHQLYGNRWAQIAHYLRTRSMGAIQAAMKRNVRFELSLRFPLMNENAIKRAASDMAKDITCTYVMGLASPPTSQVYQSFIIQRVEFYSRKLNNLPTVGEDQDAAYAAICCAWIYWAHLYGCLTSGLYN